MRRRRRILRRRRRRNPDGSKVARSFFPRKKKEETKKIRLDFLGACALSWTRWWLLAGTFSWLLRWFPRSLVPPSFLGLSAVGAGTGARARKSVRRGRARRLRSVAETRQGWACSRKKPTRDFISARSLLRRHQCLFYPIRSSFAASIFSSTRLRRGSCFVGRYTRG